MEVIARSTGVVEPRVYRVKLVEDVESFGVFPYRFKKLPITTGRIVPTVDVSVAQRYTIENLGTGNVVSISLQLLLDFGETNIFVWIVGDPLRVAPHREEQDVCLLMTMGGGYCLAGQVVLRAVRLGQFAIQATAG